MLGIHTFSYNIANDDDPKNILPEKHLKPSHRFLLDHLGDCFMKLAHFHAYHYLSKNK